MVDEGTTFKSAKLNLPVCKSVPPIPGLISDSRSYNPNEFNGLAGKMGFMPALVLFLGPVGWRKGTRAGINRVVLPGERVRIESDADYGH